MATRKISKAKLAALKKTGALIAAKPNEVMPEEPAQPDPNEVLLDALDNANKVSEENANRIIEQLATIELSPQVEVVGTANPPVKRVKVHNITHDPKTKRINTCEVEIVEREQLH